MGNTTPPFWVLRNGSHWLVHRVTYTVTVTRKGLILNRRELIGRIELAKQGLVFSPITITDAEMLIPESGSEQEGRVMTTTRVELMLERYTSKPWDTYWSSNEKKVHSVINNINTFVNINKHIGNQEHFIDYTEYNTHSYNTCICVK